jgi:hypothetical protein
MPVIDVQVHPFDRNHPGRPWASPSHRSENGLLTRMGAGGSALAHVLVSCELRCRLAMRRM